MYQVLDIVELQGSAVTAHVPPETASFEDPVDSTSLRAFIQCPQRWLKLSCHTAVSRSELSTCDLCTKGITGNYSGNL